MKGYKELLLYGNTKKSLRGCLYLGNSAFIFMRIKFYRTAIIGINDKTTFLYQTLVELHKNKGLTLKKELVLN